MTIEIKVGRTYRGKKPEVVGFGYVNDRQVLWMNHAEVQYDSPSVRNGRHYPKVPLVKFIAWADHDVTDGLPKGEWMDWPTYAKERANNRRSRDAMRKD